VRSNKGGIAVTGEVTLHADNLYVQVCDAWGGNHLQLLFALEGAQGLLRGHEHNLNFHLASFDDIVQFCQRITRNV
jgi:hypothetical protein